MEPKKRIWIVGGSSGIGLELVKLCLQNNYQVVVSSRNATKTKILNELKQNLPQQLYLLDMDVTSKKDIKEKVLNAWSVFDGLDIWFYNAGAYNVMGIDDWDSEKFETMNEVNYLGVVRLMTELVPYFKTAQKGHWVWNSSLSSYFGLPQGGGYSAPKAALVNLAQSIQPELDMLSIKLQIINHGFVKTRLTEKNKFKMPQLMEPKYTAQKILEGIENSSSFEIRFPYILSFILRLLRFLPYKLSLYLTKKSL
jgi:short-subunit dehydrogenase